MNDPHLVILFVALIADWFIGEPKGFWLRLHPVVLAGNAIGFADRHLNRDELTDSIRYRNGAVTIAILILISIALGVLLDWLFSFAGIFGMIGEGMIVFLLLAQNSLKTHVEAVVNGLGKNGLEGGRKAVAHIVGRDPETLDKEDIARASIETLAENFSDGVVAPAFWYAVFGLPGILTYKLINTADSMIGYRNEKYNHFGRVSAQIDDLANWLPARISAVLIAIAAGLKHGVSAARDALKTVLMDASLHRSPNSGWPEAAFAGALGFALGGPRQYAHNGRLEKIAQAHLNASGKLDLSVEDIKTAIGLFTHACFLLIGLTGLTALLALFCLFI